MNQKLNRSAVLRCAGSFVAGAIGSGFATGQEIMQFFSAYGIKGIIGALITTIIFSLCGLSFLKDGYMLHPEKPGEIIEYYLGHPVGKVFRAFILVFQFCVLVIMITGAGATVSEMFGIPAFIGRTVMAVMVFFAVIIGLSRLSLITSIIGAVVIVSAIGTGLFGFLSNASGILNADAAISTLPLSKTEGGWLWSGILYPAFNAVVVANIGCGLGKRAGGRREAIYGGLLGGLLFGVAVFCMNMGLLANIETVWADDIPTLSLAEMIHPAFKTLFSGIILCGIFSTSVSLLWSVSRRFAGEGTAGFSLAAGALAAVSVLIGQTDFKILVGLIYPFSGYIGLILLAAIFAKLFHSSFGAPSGYSKLFYARRS